MDHNDLKRSFFIWAWNECSTFAYHHLRHFKIKLSTRQTFSWLALLDLCLSFDGWLLAYFEHFSPSANSFCTSKILGEKKACWCSFALLCGEFFCSAHGHVRLLWAQWEIAQTINIHFLFASAKSPYCWAHDTCHFFHQEHQDGWAKSECDIFSLSTLYKT